MITFRIQRSGLPLTDLAEKHYGPALVHGINNTLERIQEITRAGLPSRFILRTPASRRVLSQLVSIDRDEFASEKQNRYRGRVGLKASVGASEGIRRFARRFVRFEFGGVETSSSGRPLYVPDGARPSPQATIRGALYPKALGLLERRTIEGGEAFHARGKSRKAGVHSTARGVFQLKGKLRTFAIDPRFSPEARAFGIWQRLGREGETDRLWRYVRQVRYPRRLSFRADSQRIVTQHLPLAIRDYLAKRAVTTLVRDVRR